MEFAQQYMTEEKLCDVLGITKNEIKSRRDRKIFRRGIHYQAFGSRTYMYSYPLILDLIDNIDTPEIHERNIRNYLRAKEVRTFKTPTAIAA